MAIPILVLFPLLLLLTSKEKWYPYFFKVARFWATFVIFGSGFLPKLKKEVFINVRESYMFIGNHTSMLDIMLMLYCIKNPFVFVGKKELTRVPIFGYFYQRTCILVDRGSQKSRQEVFEKAQQRIQNKTSICIFPEGGVSDDLSIRLGPFKDGAFRLAIDHQIDIIPVTFLDNKKRFPYHPFKGNPGIARVYIHQPISTSGLTQKDKRNINEQARALIDSKLISNQL